MTSNLFIYVYIHSIYYGKNGYLEPRQELQNQAEARRVHGRGVLFDSMRRLSGCQKSEQEIQGAGIVHCQNQRAQVCRSVYRIRNSYISPHHF